MRLRTGIVCLLMMYLSLSLNAGVACDFSSTSLDSVPMEHSLSFGFIAGNSGDRGQGEHGLDLKYTFQLQLTPYFSTGIGTGWMSLSSGTAEQVVPFYLRLDLHATKQHSAVPFFVLDTGIGVPSNTGGQFSTVAVQGGWYFSPSAGLTIPISRVLDMRIGCGYIHQKMSFELSEWGQIIRERVHFHRLKLFIGVRL